MKIHIPENIRKYVENERTVPLVDIKGTLWYSITEEEKAALVAFVADLDAMPRGEWLSLPEPERWVLACMLNDAERIIRNSVIKEEI
jgi:hypothetical protein